MTKDEAFNSFVGGWQLVSCLETRPDGQVTEPIGPRPVGQIMYSADGHMTAHLLPGGEPRDPSWRSYIGYFGRFTVDPDQGVVTHHVVGASEPDMIGTEQPRDFQFEGDRLILQAERAEGRARITWERRDERG
jgi:hypothetical protein